jgi:hypothetical protein
VLGFSQGASLAASVMLDRHMQMLDGRLDLTLPFRFAVFLCTGLPYDVQAGRGEDKREAWSCQDAVFRLGPETEARESPCPWRT